MLVESMQCSFVCMTTQNTSHSQHRKVCCTRHKRSAITYGPVSGLYGLFLQRRRAVRRERDVQSEKHSTIHFVEHHVRIVSAAGTSQRCKAYAVVSALRFV